MAATEITVTRVEKEKVVAIPTTAAVDTADGASVDWNCADGKLLLIVENADSAASKSATVVNGGGLQGMGDLTVSIAQSSKMAIVLDSGKYKQVSGAYKGKLWIKGEDANIKVAAMELT
jgi:hypothetical protein